eukprot:11525873-Ditylum_brightwellii.AAC.1
MKPKAAKIVPATTTTNAKVRLPLASLMCPTIVAVIKAAQSDTFVRNQKRKERKCIAQRSCITLVVFWGGE